MRRYSSLLSPLSSIELEGVVQNNMHNGGGVLNLSGINLQAGGGDDQLLVASSLIGVDHINVSDTNPSAASMEQLLHALLEVSSLLTFQAKNNRLGKEAGVGVARLLGRPGRLQLLDLAFNNLGDVGCASIAGAFTTDLSTLGPQVQVSLLTLHTLDLSNNELGDMACLALSRGLAQFSRHTSALGRSPSLRVLRLHANRIGDKGASCLANLLCLGDTEGKGGFCLDELGLNDNTSITHRGMLALLGSPSMQHEGLADVSRSTTSTTSKPVNTIRRLQLARCKPTLEVLEMLAINLQNGSLGRLETLDLQFTEQAAFEAVRAARSKASGSYLSEVINKLAVAIMSPQHMSPTSPSPLTSLQLGCLPEAIRRECEDAEEEGNDVLLADSRRALISLFSSSSVIKFPVEIRPWFLAKVPFAAASMSPASTLLPQTPSVHASLSSLYIKSLSQSNSIKTIDSDTHMAVMQAMEESASMPSKEEDEGRREPFASFTSPSSPTRTSSFSSSSSSSLAQSLEQQQQKFLHLRREHASAFNTLASEINLLASTPQYVHNGRSFVEEDDNLHSVVSQSQKRRSSGSSSNARDTSGRGLSPSAADLLFAFSNGGNLAKEAMTQQVPLKHQQQFQQQQQQKQQSPAASFVSVSSAVPLLSQQAEKLAPTQYSEQENSSHLHLLEKVEALTKRVEELEASKTSREADLLTRLDEALRSNKALVSSNSSLSRRLDNLESIFESETLNSIKLLTSLEKRALERDPSAALQIDKTAIPSPPPTSMTKATRSTSSNNNSNNSINSHLSLKSGRREDRR